MNEWMDDMADGWWIDDGWMSGWIADGWVDWVQISRSVCLSVWWSPSFVLQVLYQTVTGLKKNLSGVLSVRPHSPVGTTNRTDLFTCGCCVLSSCFWLRRTWSSWKCLNCWLKVIKIICLKWTVKIWGDVNAATLRCCQVCDRAGVTPQVPALLEQDLSSSSSSSSSSEQEEHNDEGQDGDQQEQTEEASMDRKVRDTRVRWLRQEVVINVGVPTRYLMSGCYF